eukprot:2145002-Pyramimonas_sp.AAC.1
MPDHSCCSPSLAVPRGAPRARPAASLRRRPWPGRGSAGGRARRFTDPSVQGSACLALLRGPTTSRP